MSEAKLRQELEEAFRARAHFYRAIYDELEAELGAERAEEILARAIERRGRQVAGALFADFTTPDAIAIGERFLSVSPDRGRLYPARAERRERGLSISVRRCPLKDAWSDSGLSANRIATLCRIAGAFDKGLFEAAGIRFRNETWCEGRPGCCHIHLDDPPT
jgi:L-2-amino-thiazoline-4-carboxylic acid hydrolase